MSSSPTGSPPPAQAERRAPASTHAPVDERPAPPPQPAPAAAVDAEPPSVPAAPPAAPPHRPPPCPRARSQRRNLASQQQQERLEELKASVHTELLKELGPQLYDADMDQAELDQRVRAVLADVLSGQDRPISNCRPRSGSPRRSATTSSATARSSPSCVTRTSPR